MAYTYLLGWKIQNKWYYGCRYASAATPDDLFVSYFTSSKYVREFIKIHGNPDIIQIRKIFESKEGSLIWENRVLKRLWKHKDFWLNKKFDNTKYVIDEITIQNNILSKKNRSEERQVEVLKNISKGSKQGHLNRSKETKDRVSKIISDKNKNRDKSVNKKISSTISKIHSRRAAEEWSIIENKKKITRQKSKEEGKVRKSPAIAYRCCLCCKKQFDPGNFSKHIKDVK